MLDALSTIAVAWASVDVRLIAVADERSISSSAVVPADVILIPPADALSTIASAASSLDVRLIAVDDVRSISSPAVSPLSSLAQNTYDKIYQKSTSSSPSDALLEKVKRKKEWQKFFFLGRVSC